MPVLTCTSSVWQLHYLVAPRASRADKPDAAGGGAGDAKRRSTPISRSKSLDVCAIVGAKRELALRGYYSRASRKWVRERRRVREGSRVPTFCRAHDAMYEEACRTLNLLALRFECEVSGAGMGELNGIYRATGARNGTIRFKRKVKAQNSSSSKGAGAAAKTRVYQICRATVKRSQRVKWFICRSDRNGIDADIDFYNADQGGMLPPTSGWVALLGKAPAPTIRVRALSEPKLQPLLLTKHFEEAYMCEMFKRRPELVFARFPAMQTVCAKASLTRCIEALRPNFPHLFSFYPRSWNLDNAAGVERFRRESGLGVREKSGREGATRPGDAQRCFILKPDGGLQGMGIALAMDWDDVEAAMSKNNQLEQEWESQRNDPEMAKRRADLAREERHQNVQPSDRHLGSLIAQDYIAAPALLGGAKFDMRVYVCVRSLRPLKAVVMKEGLARLCTAAYQPPTRKNISNAYMHLTNYHLNVTNDAFRQPGQSDGEAVVDAKGSDATKRSVRIALAQLGADPEAFWSQIARIVSLALLSMLPRLRREYSEKLLEGADGRGQGLSDGASKGGAEAGGESSAGDGRWSPGFRDPWQRCFQIIGFDVMLDSNMRAHLLEINDHPSLKSPTPLDQVIKAGVMRAAVRLFDPDPEPIPERKIRVPTRPRPQPSAAQQAQAATKPQEEPKKRITLQMETMVLEPESEYKRVARAVLGADEAERKDGETA